MRGCAEQQVELQETPVEGEPHQEGSRQPRSSFPRRKNAKHRVDPEDTCKPCLGSGLRRRTRRENHLLMFAGNQTLCLETK